MEMKRKRTEWALVRISKKKMREMEAGFKFKSMQETQNNYIVFGRFNRAKQKRWAYHLMFKRWLARKELREMIV